MRPNPKREEEEEEEEEEEDEQDICPSPATTSPFAFETPKTLMVSPQSLSPFSFSSPASANACIKSPEVSTPPGLLEASPEEDAVHAERNCLKLRTASEARTTFLSTDSPEVVECADVVEKMLQTI